MANALYPLWKSSLMKEADLAKSLDQDNDTDGVYVALVDSTAGHYVYSGGHQFYTSLTNVQAEIRIGIPVVNGPVFNGDVLVYVGVSGTTVSSIVFTRRNAGLNSTWRLVAYMDDGIIGFPILANGGNIVVDWPVIGIFSL